MSRGFADWVGRRIRWDRYARYNSSLSARVCDIVIRGVVVQLGRCVKALKARDWTDAPLYAGRAFVSAVIAGVLITFPLVAAVFGDQVGKYGVWFALGGLGWLVVSEVQEHRARIARYRGEELENELGARAFFGLLGIECAVFFAVKYGLVDHLAGRTKVFALGVAFGAVADGTNTALTILFARVPYFATALGLERDDLAGPNAPVRVLESRSQIDTIPATLTYPPAERFEPSPAPPTLEPGTQPE